MKIARVLRNLSLPDWLAIASFALFLVIGLYSYQSYGLSTDEPTQWMLGAKNFRFYSSGDPAILTMRDRWYGPLFEMFLILFQSRGNDLQVFLSRHLLTFLAFYAGCLAFYFLARKFTRNSWLAMIGLVCFFISPRIFADSFYNTKDIPFMVAYSFCLLTLLVFLEKPSPWKAVLHGVFTAALLASRLPGVIIPALTLGGLALDSVAGRISWRKTAGYFTIYLMVSAGLCILVWPALWPDPFGGFLEAFRFMSRFPHQAGMLYFGEIIQVSETPWHYGLVWIAITTPLLYLAGFGWGTVQIIRNLGNSFRHFRPSFSPSRRNEALILAACLGPILTVILMKSVLYGGWRHLFFIYPAFLLVMLEGFRSAFNWLLRLTRRTVAVGISAVVFALGILPVAAWMIQHHPYQNVYFNRLAGKDMQTIQQRFQMDYWGLTYRRGLEAILDLDANPSINVFMEREKQSLAMISPDEQKRLHHVDTLEDADYFIGNYYDIRRTPYPFKNEVFKIMVGNARILSVFRLTPDEQD